MKIYKMLSIGLVAVTLTACAGNTGAQMQWDTEAVERGDLTTYVIASGAVRPNRAADLNWSLGGTIGEVKADIGDLVKQDDPLADLEPDSLGQAYYSARIELINAQQALDDLLEGSDSQSAGAYRALLDAQEAYDDAVTKRGRMDKRNGSDGQIAAAQANYTLAQDKVDILQGKYNNTLQLSEEDPVRALALANLENAKKERDRAMINLNWYKGHATEEEIIEAEADLAVLKSQLDQAQRDYDRLKDGVPAVDLEIAQARVASAEAVLRQLELTAPFDGTITDVRAQSGAPVTVGTLAFRMEDRSRLLVDVTIAEMDINRIRVDMPVIITFDSIYNKEYKGRVVSVSLSGERNSGVVTYPVTVELEDPDELVRSGMSAVVKISVDTVKDALLVPNKAVRMINNQRVVYVQKTDNPMPVKVNIQLGLSSETVSEVLTAEDETDGLQPGDLVVTNPDLLVQMEQSN